MTDDLITALAGPPPKDSRKSCYYSIWLGDQTPEVQAAVEGAMKNQKWKTAPLYRLLVGKGYDKQYNTLRMHRAGECSCDD